MNNSGVEVMFCSNDGLKKLLSLKKEDLGRLKTIVCFDDFTAED